MPLVCAGCRAEFGDDHHILVPTAAELSGIAPAHVLSEAEPHIQRQWRSVWFAYMLWVIGGIFGLHAWYLRRRRWALFMLAGGLLWLALPGCRLTNQWLWVWLWDGATLYIQCAEFNRVLQVREREKVCRAWWEMAVT